MSFEFQIDKKDYESCNKYKVRSASRGIAIIGDKLVMVKSSKYGEYKFPGGGVEANESLVDALKREFMEEAGMEIELIDKEPLIIFKEKRKSTYDNNEMYDHTSYYYLVKVVNHGQSELQDYEIDYNYNVILTTLGEAISANEYLVDNTNTDMIPWTMRELMVLKFLKENDYAIYS